MSTPFTLGVVSYLNALPLYRTLEARGEVRIIRVVPSKLAGLLEAGECDAAIMPVVDFLRGVGESIISDACIGTKLEGAGNVRSVLLFHRVPLEKIGSVAVDTSSHSSVALTRIILADAHGVLPPFHEHAPNLAQMLRHHEAALLIGDAALEAKAAVEVSIDNPKAHILDLGAAWKELTGLPFVFAAWAARRVRSVRRSARSMAIVARHASTSSPLNALRPSIPAATRASSAAERSGNAAVNATVSIRELSASRTG